MEKWERSNIVSIKIREKEGGESAPDAGAKTSLMLIKKTPVEQVNSLQPVKRTMLEKISTLQCMEEQVNIS